MKKYELVVLIRADVKAKEKDAFVEKIEKMVKSFDGTAKTFKEQGTKQLAYPIKHLKEATYLTWVLELAASHLVELDKRLVNDPDILRHIVVAS